MGFRIGDSTNVVIACIVSSYGQMEIEMKKLWPSSLLLLQRNDISKVEKPVREYALHDWICQAEVWITNFCKYELFLVHLNPSKHHPLYSTPLYIFNFFASRDAPPPLQITTKHLMPLTTYFLIWRELSNPVFVIWRSGRWSRFLSNLKFRDRTLRVLILVVFTFHFS